MVSIVDALCFMLCFVLFFAILFIDFDFACWNTTSSYATTTTNSTIMRYYSYRSDDDCMIDCTCISSITNTDNTTILSAISTAAAAVDMQQLTQIHWVVFAFQVESTTARWIAVNGSTGVAKMKDLHGLKVAKASTFGKDFGNIGFWYTELF